MSSAPTDIEGSILGKLPLELRRMVYRACFDNTAQNVIATRFSNILLSSVSPAILTTNMGALLAPLQVSSQMRCEAIDLLLGGKTVIIYRNMANDTVNSPMIYLSAQQIASLGFAINMIPIQLRSPRLTYELRHDCLMDGNVSHFPHLTATNFARKSSSRPCNHANLSCQSISPITTSPPIVPAIRTTYKGSRRVGRCCSCAIATSR